MIVVPSKEKDVIVFGIRISMIEKSSLYLSR